MFANLQDIQDLRVASIVFWSALFAIQRGIPDTGVAHGLWSTIWCSKLPKAFKDNHTEDDAKLVWQFEENTLLRDFENKFIAWKDEWVDSLAGRAYSEWATHKKYASLFPYSNPQVPKAQEAAARV